MNIVQISFSYKRTINLGNYESAAFECTMTADLNDQFEVPEDAAEELRDRAREQVRLEATRLMEARKESE